MNERPPEIVGFLSKLCLESQRIPRMSTHHNRRRHTRVVQKRRGQVGVAPDALVAAPGAQKSLLQLFGYSRDGFIERETADIPAVTESLKQWPVTWVNVDGVADIEMLRRIAEVFRLHPLALEDVVHVHQRPKVEPYAEHLFIVVRMYANGDSLNTEQLSIFLGDNFVLTFQEHRPGDCLDPVRARIRNGLGRLRGAGPDYLAYAILDTVIDNYFPLVERYGDQLEVLDDAVVDRPHEETIRRIHDIRHDLLVLRRTVAPLRDAVGILRSDDSGLLSDDTKLYLRDCYDHVVHLVENIQSYQDISAWHMEAALSSLNFRSSEIMKMLTLIATIFMPLSFIAGVYGMNFSPEQSPLNMPELNWYFGYPFALGLMATVASGLMLYFRRKNWI